MKQVLNLLRTTLEKFKPPLGPVLEFRSYSTDITNNSKPLVLLIAEMLIYGLLNNFSLRITFSIKTYRSLYYIIAEINY